MNFVYLTNTAPLRRAASGLHRLRKLAGWTGTERVLFLKTTAAVLGMRVALKTFPFSRVLRLVNRLSQPPDVTRSPSTVEPRELIHAVERAGRSVVKNNSCLPLALVLVMLFRRHGYSADLRIGILKNRKGLLEAHAWVESENSVVLGGLDTLSDYILLPDVEAFALLNKPLR